MYVTCSKTTHAVGCTMLMEFTTLAAKAVNIVTKHGYLTKQSTGGVHDMCIQVWTPTGWVGGCGKGVGMYV